jgi:retinol dehydrogenase 12
VFTVGAATVAALAAHNPSCIYLCARKKANANDLVDNLQQKYPDATIQILELDLASFDSVKQCATEFKRLSDRLDILILNAGVAALDPGLTKEGYELQFGEFQRAVSNEASLSSCPMSP